jgi:hypothetical protein
LLLKKTIKIAIPATNGSGRKYTLKSTPVIAKRQSSLQKLQLQLDLNQVALQHALASITN